MDEISLYTRKNIENRIFTIRGVQVIIDRDLAEMYQVETRVLNQAVKRNIERFPDDFMFQLNETEWNILKSQFVISSSHGGSRKLPYVFTEQGVAGLSGVLKSEISIKVNIAIMRAFVTLRKLLLENVTVFRRLDRIELKQLENEQKFEQVFKALESKNELPTQGIFFDGQIFDAYKLVSEIIRSARQSIVLIDNYIDETTLTILSKKGINTKVLLLTKSITKQLILDIEKANQQYKNFTLHEFNKSHDRFLIIDETEIYHLGASLKDLGRKWFAFSRMDKCSVDSILKAIHLI